MPEQSIISPFQHVTSDCQPDRLLDDALDASGLGMARPSVTNRIKAVSQHILSKGCTAHSIRHAVGQRWTHLFGLAVAAEKLRHKSIDTTRDYYADVKITEEQFQEATSLERGT